MIRGKTLSIWSKTKKKEQNEKGKIEIRKDPGDLSIFAILHFQRNVLKVEHIVVQL